MVFAPKVSGESQGLIHDTVKEYMLQELQQTSKNSKDIANNLRKGEGMGMKGTMPARKIAIKIETTNTIENDPAKLVDMTEMQRLEQEGPDVEFQLDLNIFEEKENAHAAYKHKVFAIACGCCNKTMQNQIK